MWGPHSKPSSFRDVRSFSLLTPVMKGCVSSIMCSKALSLSLRAKYHLRLAALAVHLKEVRILNHVEEVA